MAAVPSIGRATRVEGAPAPEAELTRALYEQYAAQIFRYCLHQLGSREEAEDAVQSTFLNAFRGVKRGVVPEIESAWLFKIAHNVCLSRRRSTWRRARVESPADFDVVEELTPAPSRRADELIGLEDALGQMPEQQRRAILLREWQGLSYREIGEELELSQSAVETLIFRARRSLAHGLEQPVVVETRKGKRLAAGALGNLVSFAQSFLLGGGAAVKVAAVVAAAGVGTVVATAPVHHRAFSGDVEQPAERVQQQHSAPAPSGTGVAVLPPVRVAPVRHHPSQQRAARRRVHTHAPSRAAPVVSSDSTSGTTTAVVPPVVAQPAQTPASPAAAPTDNDAAPGQLRKATGSLARGNGKDSAPGQRTKGSSTPATAAVAPDAGGETRAPGQQKKDDRAAVVPASDSPPAAAPTAPPAPAPASDHSDNGNGNGKGT